MSFINFAKYLSVSLSPKKHLWNVSDIIDSLPESLQCYAHKVFKRFSKTFNEVLPSIELLFECEENPFISKLDKKKVDLGDGNPLTLDSSIAFSLPSMVTGKEKGGL